MTVVTYVSKRGSTWLIGCPKMPNTNNVAKPLAFKPKQEGSKSTNSQMKLSSFVASDRTFWLVYFETISWSPITEYRLIMNGSRSIRASLLFMSLNQSLNKCFHLNLLVIISKSWLFCCSILDCYYWLSSSLLILSSLWISIIQLIWPNSNLLCLVIWISLYKIGSFEDQAEPFFFFFFKNMILLCFRRINKLVQEAQPLIHSCSNTRYWTSQLSMSTYTTI